MAKRESWGSKLGFVMATAGSAVGLGSLWKFPYVTGENGGGLFVLAYLVFTFLIGVPIFIAELLMGRTAKRAPVGTFEALSKHKTYWKMLGWSTAFTSILILSFYAVVAGWALNYTLMSLLHFTAGKSPAQISGVFNVLDKAGDITVLWTGLFLALTTGIVFRGVQQGIEFWSKILMPILFAILLLLFGYAMTLDGAGQAFAFVFEPRWGKLTTSGLLQALGLACFTLSAGMGILITYGSYMRKQDDIPKTAFTVAGIDIFVSIIAALTIFPIIFSFGFSPEEGPGLLFKTMPVLFSKLPGTLLVSTTFFVLVVFAALTSTISIMEILVATVTEGWNLSRRKAALIVGAAVFILSIPSSLSGSEAMFRNWSAIFGKNFFMTMDDLSFIWLLPINATLTAIFAGWIFDSKMRKEAFCEGSVFGKFFVPWLFLLRYVVPVGVFLILLEQSGIISI